VRARQFYDTRGVQGHVTPSISVSVREQVE
jgi:hypothetical protein